MQLKPFYSFIFFLWLVATQAQATVTEYQYRITAQYPHDKTAFTQGLLIHNGTLYESAGLYGQSKLITRELSSTKPIQTQPIPSNLFAEGISIFNNKLYQLTWKAQTGFLYNPATLKVEKTFTYQGEGWGLTANRHYLIMSNGSDTLTFRDPNSFKIIKTLKVTQNNQPVTHLNELEWINGLIAANIWRKPIIIFIHPDTGMVVGTLNLKKLQPWPQQKNVLNGIAYNPENHRVYITGKYWKTLYELKVTPEPSIEPINHLTASPSVNNKATMPN